MKPSTSRVRRIVCNKDVLAHMFTEERGYRVLKGMPPGSRVYSFHIDEYRNTITLYVENPAFSEVAEGALIPELETQMECVPYRHHDLSVNQDDLYPAWQPIFKLNY